MIKRTFLIVILVSMIFYAYITHDFSPPSVKISEKNYGVLEKRQLCTPVELRKTEVQYYNQSSDPFHQFEYRYEFNEQKSSAQSRLLVLLTGRYRSCIDWWDFSAGERIISAMRSSGFSILAICTAAKQYQYSTPIQENKHVYWIYTTFQKWINDVYHKRFGHYPRLYLLGLSAGSMVASLLSRVLPVQAQILYIAPGDSNSSLHHSDHSREFQGRLIADPVFASWFYFGYCSKEELPTDNRCLFRQQNKNYFNPVPPTYFIHVARDTHLPSLIHYEAIISAMRKDLLQLGGELLTQNNTVKLFVVPPGTATPDSMTKYFKQWTCKPSHSRLVYEHLINSTFRSSSERTCWCVEVDFLYFTKYPNITKFWSQTDQDNYSDYVSDLNLYRFDFCETLCGDVLAYHQMISHHIGETIQWLDQMDEQRSLFRINEYLRRPLRLWMYKKEELVHNKTHLTYGSPMNSTCARHLPTNQMYSIEYFLQDYFEQLNHSYPSSKHNLVWTNDPLLADYYIIPHDLTCMGCTEVKPSMTSAQFYSMAININQNYFIPLLNNVRMSFPYWNISAGSNHLISFSNGLNMGSVPDISVRKTFENMIVLGYTGFRQDLLPPSSPSLYTYKRIIPFYRHNYDILIPPFNRLQWVNDKSVTNSSYWDRWYEQKRSLFFFAGTVNKSEELQSVRHRLSLLMQKKIGRGQKYANITKIGETDFQTMLLIDGRLSSADYAQAIRSSIFLLCPEGVSPWSPRLYESINFGTVPLILARSIVLPFERFVQWRSFSTKISVDKVEKIIDIVKNIEQFKDHIKNKLKNAAKYFHAFRWPYSPSDQHYDRHSFLPNEDIGGAEKNVFHYLSLELRCRRLEQLYGLELNAFSTKSLHAKRQACQNHPTICPCSEETTSIATEEFL